mgnify:CR=1 FL=1
MNNIIETYEITFKQNRFDKDINKWFRFDKDELKKAVDFIVENGGELVSVKRVDEIE